MLNKSALCWVTEVSAVHATCRQSGWFTTPAVDFDISCVLVKSLIHWFFFNSVQSETNGPVRSLTGGVGGGSIPPGAYVEEEQDTEHIISPRVLSAAAHCSLALQDRLIP